MRQGKVIGFDAEKLKQAMMDNAVAENNRRLVDYAKKEILEVGNRILSYGGAHHLDRTGTLLNSLCWGVYHNGKKIDSGFFREAATRNMGGNKGSTSFLHEFFPNDMEEVRGRELAENFLKSYKAKANGWTVFFAVLAPYWGYWESGFTMKSGGGNSGIPRSTRFMQFQVMTHIYDDVRMALKPAETHFTVYVPKYMYKSRKWNKKLKNRVGVKKIGILR